MDTSEFVDVVREKLSELARADPEFTIFASGRYKYKLNPTLSQSELQRLEAEHGFRCPESYRAFLMQLGNGGAGPFYGVFPFGEIDDGAGTKSWSGLKLRPGAPFPHTHACNGWEACVEGYPGAPEYDDFDDEDAYFEALSEFETEHWIPIFSIYFDELGLSTGALPISRRGCGARDWLIVTGPEAGHVWHDRSADHGGVAPVTLGDKPRATFADWYMNWIDGSLAKLRSE